MKLMVKNISYILNDDEGLNSLFFEHENGYFCISRLNDEDNIYMELNDQSNGEYFEQDIFDSDFSNGKISFKIDLDNKKIIEYLKSNNKKYDSFININIIFKPVEQKMFKIMGEVYKNIFNQLF